MPDDLWEPNFDRLLTVLRREGEPDRMPFFELGIDQPVVEAIMGEPQPAGDDGRRYRIEFQRRMGYDYVRAGVDYYFQHAPTLQTADTAEVSTGVRGWRDERGGTIASWEDLQAYVWPDPAKISFDDVRGLAPLLPAGMKCNTSVAGVWEYTVLLMGFERLCYLLADEPELVRAVADGVGARQLAMYDRLCEFEQIGSCMIADDLGFKTHTMVSPAHLREIFLPWLARIVDCIHSHDKPAILHSCGTWEPIIEDLIAAGFDGFHSFEDVIEPVAEFKRRFGDRVAVLGGIDVHVLASSTEEQVRAYTRRVIEQSKPGGGYALGSGNTVANYIPVCNYLAMLDEGRKLGAY